MVAIACMVAGDKLADGGDAAIKWLPESSATRIAIRIVILRFKRSDKLSAHRNESKKLTVDRICWPSLGRRINKKEQCRKLTATDQPT
jgi:hypothetical protein